jgi:hypothetical protein
VGTSPSAEEVLPLKGLLPTRGWGQPSHSGTTLSVSEFATKCRVLLGAPPVPYWFSGGGGVFSAFSVCPVDGYFMSKNSLTHATHTLGLGVDTGLFATIE